MINLKCRGCEAEFPSASATQPLAVEVVCPKCGRAGPAYKFMPGRKLMPYDEGARKRPCPKCGRNSLSWDIEPLGKTGLVTCNTAGCDWLAEVF